MAWIDGGLARINKTLEITPGDGNILSEVAGAGLRLGVSA
jgi:hypothetical protein